MRTEIDEATWAALEAAGFTVTGLEDAPADIMGLRQVRWALKKDGHIFSVLMHGEDLPPLPDGFTAADSGVPQRSVYIAEQRLAALKAGPDAVFETRFGAMKASI